jgi:hypothetical protein
MKNIVPANKADSPQNIIKEDAKSKLLFTAVFITSLSPNIK